MSTLETLKQNTLTRNFRFWPVYASAFARTFSYTIYGLALPNYLIYFQHVSPSLIGEIVAVYSLAFIFGPLFALPITKKVGIRNAVTFSTIGSVVSVGLQLLIFEPWALILLRALDGFIVGFFWPDLQMEISNWQRVAPREFCDRFFRTYANSWGTGILLGELVGYVIVLTGSGNEFAALIFSWIAMIAMIPCALAMENPQIELQYSGSKGFAYEHSSVLESEESPANQQLKADEAEKQKNSKSSPEVQFLLAFPAMFYLLGTLIYAYLKAFYPFILPFYLTREGIPSYWVYLITLCHQIIQMVFIMLWSTKTAKAGYKGLLIAFGMNIFFVIWLSLNAGLLVIILAFIINGALSALFYSFTSKIMLQYGNSTGSLKYATYYEFFNGIGFGFAPLIAGLISDESLWLNFPILFGILIVFALALLYLSKAAVKYL